MLPPSLRLLDEKELSLHAEDLMINDAEKPMCLAGVFGGFDSGVTEHNG
jgi:phenylalanyl-tRNA synthetase beta chain